MIIFNVFQDIHYFFEDTGPALQYLSTIILR